MKKKNYYNILGIQRNATTEDVKKAYRRLVHKCHPDIVGNSPENIEKFKEITEAYETLSSPQKREQYDSINRLYEYAEGVSEGVKDGGNGKKSQESNFENKEPEKNNAGTASKKHKSDNDDKKKTSEKDNTFSKMRAQAKENHNKNIFTNFINNLLDNKPKQKKYTPPKVDGKDITTEVTLSIDEAINGTERIVNILHMETCEKCRGRKFINGSICPACGGAGEKSKYKKLTVKIPAQVKNNSKIRVEGEGNKGFNGGKRGNLYLIVKIENNTDVQYDGLNILRSVSIAPYEAVLGGYITFEMNGENIRMKLMQNTYNGQKYRIAGQGLEKNGKHGDLIVTVVIDIPKDLSAEEIELYEKLKMVAKRTARKSKE